MFMTKNKWQQRDDANLFTFKSDLTQTDNVSNLVTKVNNGGSIGGFCAYFARVLYRQGEKSDDLCKACGEKHGHESEMRIERGFDNLEKVGAVWAYGAAHGGAAGALTWASGLLKMSNEHARAFQAHHLKQP